MLLTLPVTIVMNGYPPPPPTGGEPLLVPVQVLKFTCEGVAVEIFSKIAMNIRLFSCLAV